MTETSRLLRLRDVLAITGISRSNLYRMESLGQFPQRVRITPATSGWREDEVRAWVDSRPRARDVTNAAGLKAAHG